MIRMNEIDFPPDLPSSTSVVPQSSTHRQYHHIVTTMNSTLRHETNLDSVTGRSTIKHIIIDGYLEQTGTTAKKDKGREHEERKNRKKNKHLKQSDSDNYNHLGKDQLDGEDNAYVVMQASQPDEVGQGKSHGDGQGQPHSQSMATMLVLSNMVIIFGGVLLSTVYSR